MRAVVIGAGAWGTAIAIHLARKGHEVTLRARNHERARRLAEARENEVYLPGVKFPERLSVTDGPPGPSDFTAGAVPTQHIREFYSEIRADLPHVPFVSLANGIEVETGLLPTKIVRDVLGRDLPVTGSSLRQA